MKLRLIPSGLIAEDAENDRWVQLPGEHDLLAFLAKRPEEREAAFAGATEPADPASAGLPFRPR